MGSQPCPPRAWDAGSRQRLVADHQLAGLARGEQKGAQRRRCKRRRASPGRVVDAVVAAAGGAAFQRCRIDAIRRGLSSNSSLAGCSIAARTSR